MKLRLRSLETKETLKVEVPAPCSIQQLKEIVSQRASLPSSSSSAPAPSAHLSLNRNDELLGSSPADPLQSLGVTSGDLIFFTMNPNGFSRPTLIFQSGSCSPNNPPNSTQQLNPPEALIADTKLENERPQDKNETLELNSQKEKILDYEHGTSDQAQMEETPGMHVAENMDIDNECKVNFVPGFLRKAFNKEVGECGGSVHKLVVIAVHAVLSESGFVGYDTVTRMKTEGFYLPDVWPLPGYSISLCYTIPETILQGPRTYVESVNGVETVVLKVQSLGKYVNFYGSLARKGSATYRVCLNEERLAFVLNLMWANYDSVVETNSGGGLSNLCPEKEVFEFWKTVKDSLALPLLMDLCEKANLPPPPCFTRLPTDVKLMILELLPGVDLAKVACVSSELRFLSSYDDLWKQKLIDQYGEVIQAGEVVEGPPRAGYWKARFVESWEARKRRRVGIARGPPAPWHGQWFPGIIRGDINPLRVPPRIIGGDHDLGPNFWYGWHVQRAPRRNVIPHHFTFGGSRA